MKRKLPHSPQICYLPLFAGPDAATIEEFASLYVDAKAQGGRLDCAHGPEFTRADDDTRHAESMGIQGTWGYDNPLQRLVRKMDRNARRQAKSRLLRAVGGQE